MKSNEISICEDKSMLYDDKSYECPYDIIEFENDSNNTGITNLLKGITSKLGINMVIYGNNH